MIRRQGREEAKVTLEGKTRAACLLCGIPAKCQGFSFKPHPGHRSRPLPRSEACHYRQCSAESFWSSLSELGQADLQGQPPLSRLRQPLWPLQRPCHLTAQCPLSPAGLALTCRLKGLLPFISTLAALFFIKAVQRLYHLHRVRTPGPREPQNQKAPFAPCSLTEAPVASLL